MKLYKKNDNGEFEEFGDGLQVEDGDLIFLMNNANKEMCNIIRKEATKSLNRKVLVLPSEVVGKIYSV